MARRFAAALLAIVALMSAVACSSGGAIAQAVPPATTGSSSAVQPPATTAPATPDTSAEAAVGRQIFLNTIRRQDPELATIPDSELLRRGLADCTLLAAHPDQLGLVTDSEQNIGVGTYGAKGMEFSIAASFVTTAMEQLCPQVLLATGRVTTTP